jgi:hypothetical protein
VGIMILLFIIGSVVKEANGNHHDTLSNSTPSYRLLFSTEPPFIGYNVECFKKCIKIRKCNRRRSIRMVEICLARCKKDCSKPHNFNHST